MHAMKLFDFVLARDASVELLAIEQPTGDFKTVADVFEKALEQEQEVSRQIDSLYEIAFTEKAFAADAELQWFLTEQVEEEKTAARSSRSSRWSATIPRPCSTSTETSVPGRAGGSAAGRRRMRIMKKIVVRSWRSACSVAACNRSAAGPTGHTPPGAQAAAGSRLSQLPAIDQNAILERIKVLVVRRIRRTRAGHQGRRPHGQVPRWTSSRSSDSSRAIPTAPTSRKCRSSGSPDRGAAADRHERRRRSAPSSGATMSWRGPSASADKAPIDGLGHRLRRLRRRGAGVSTGTTSRTSTSRARRSSILVNDPPVPDPADPSKLDPTVVRRRGDDLLRPLDLQVSRRRREKGAAGVLIVHETEAGGLSVRRSCRAIVGENFDLVTPDKNMGRAAIEGWISLDAAKNAADDGRAGLRRAEEAGDHARVQAGAARPQGVDRGAATRCARSTRRTSSPGSRAATRMRKDEYVVYSAHWDHLGVGDAGQRRQDLQRRARQRARASAALLEMARAFTQVQPRTEALDPLPRGDRGRAGPARLAVLRRTPALPARRRPLANINIDGVNQWGRTSDLTVVGYGGVRSRRLRCATPPASRDARSARPEAGEGLLLPLGPFQLRQAGRAGARSRTRRGLHRQAAELQREEARRVHRATTITSRPTR